MGGPPVIFIDKGEPPVPHFAIYAVPHWRLTPPNVRFHFCHSFKF